MDAFQLIVRDIPESWRQLQKRDYTGVSRASRSLTWAGVPSPQLGSGLSDAAPRPTVGFSPRQTAYRARHMRILVTGASGVLGRVTVPLLRDRGHQLRCRRRPNSTCSTRSRYGRHSATSTRCCIWPATFRPPIAGAFPVPGTRTTDYETRRPDCSLTAPYLPIRRSSWCPRSRSSIRQAQPMSPRRWQTCLTVCAPRSRLKTTFAASTMRDVAASRCALVCFMDRKPRRSRPAAATTFTAHRRCRECARGRTLMPWRRLRRLR
jgi:hypothetical protein